MSTVDANALIDHLFRTEARTLGARLARAFGPRHLSEVDDIVQDALLRAVQRWPFDGIPDNPSGWLWRVARNRALDIIRRGRTFADKRTLIEADLATMTAPSAETPFAEELTDDQLALLFACCNPALPRPAQVCLTLKVGCGFGVDEIASAYLSPKATVAQRLVRAKKSLRALDEDFGIPAPEAIGPRLASVLEVLYGLFSEGYSTSLGDSVLREDLCQEALRLVRLLLLREDTATPETRALAALFCLQAARFPARIDQDGIAVPLPEQDRALWETSLRNEGFAHLAAAQGSGDPGRYHLEAAIAGCHTGAQTWEATPWESIRDFYAALHGLAPTPMTALNLAIARGHADGPETGLAALEAIDSSKLAQRHSLHAARAEFREQLDDAVGAREDWMRASACALRPENARYIQRRLAVLGAI